MPSNKRLNKVSIKNLECYLQDIEDFDEPKINLEQYATPPHIASVMLNIIDQNYDDLNGKFVADLGCGTGRLLIGSLLCGSSMSIGIDVDRVALEIALQNLKDLFSDDEDADIGQIYNNCDGFNLIQADLGSVSDDEGILTGFKFDTVIMNPPFGTRQNNLDMIFLKRAISLTNGVVYSLHKTSTRDYISRQCQLWGIEKAEPIGQFRYNLENTYKFHKRKSVDIDVDLWRIKVTR